jgi:hypothetical protein
MLARPGASTRSPRPRPCQAPARRLHSVLLAAKASAYSHVNALVRGFDFVGFNVRHYCNLGKLLIKPSKAGSAPGCAPRCAAFMARTQWP